MFVNRKKIHVEWGDCDPAGIVYFPRYFAYFDNCTAALFAAAIMPKYDLLKLHNIAGLPLVDTRAKFFHPSRFGDVIEVESCVITWRNSSFDVRHRLYRGSVLAAECEETRIWAGRSSLDPEKIEARTVPDAVIAKMGGTRTSAERKAFAHRG
jgi:4-hydroxybenzoyl-CoA thioesterase